MNNSINFCGTMKIASGMTCYKKGLNDNVVNELREIGMHESKNTDGKLDGTPTLIAENILLMNDTGVTNRLPESDEFVDLRFSKKKLKQPEFDTFLLAYNSVKDKDSDVHIDVNV